MLKPYIVEKWHIRVIGKSVSFGGSRAKTGEIGIKDNIRKKIMKSGEQIKKTSKKKVKIVRHNVV